jgi:hypothetical protein
MFYTNPSPNLTKILGRHDGVIWIELIWLRIGTSEGLLWTQYWSTELVGLFWTLSIVLYVEDKRPQRFGYWICLRPQVDGAG